MITLNGLTHTNSIDELLTFLKANYPVDTQYTPFEVVTLALIFTSQSPSLTAQVDKATATALEKHKEGVTNRATLESIALLDTLGDLEKELKMVLEQIFTGSEETTLSLTEIHHRYRALVKLPDKKLI